MGLRKKPSGHYAESCPARDQNPNPYNYKLLHKEVVNGYHILVVNYPDCTNYEGNKILVFSKVLSNPLGDLDPHFFPSSTLVARFVPSSEGMNMARRFCNLPREVS